MRQNDLPVLKLAPQKRYWRWSWFGYCFDFRKICHFSCHYGVEWWTLCVYNWNLFKKWRLSLPRNIISSAFRHGKIADRNHPEDLEVFEHQKAASQAVNKSPQRSAVKHALALRISNQVWEKFCPRPYKIMIQELKKCDWLSCQAACETMLEHFPADTVVHSSDKAYFHLLGCVSKYNFLYWAAENPRQLHERPLHSERITVWCAIWEFATIGPYFF